MTGTTRLVQHTDWLPILLRLALVGLALALALAPSLAGGTPPPGQMEGLPTAPIQSAGADWIARVTSAPALPPTEPPPGAPPPDYWPGGDCAYTLGAFVAL